MEPARTRCITTGPSSGVAQCFTAVPDPTNRYGHEFLFDIMRAQTAPCNKHNSCCSPLSSVCVVCYTENVASKCTHLYRFARIQYYDGEGSVPRPLYMAAYIGYNDNDDDDDDVTVCNVSFLLVRT